MLATGGGAWMNETTRDALIGETGDARLGWDSYRRFIEHYGTVVFGLDAKVFEVILAQGVGSRQPARSAVIRLPADVQGAYLEVCLLRLPGAVTQTIERMKQQKMRAEQCVRLPR